MVGRVIAQPLSKLLVPLAKSPQSATSIDLLNSHGFIRQVGSGIYDILPLGLRVQNKIEGIVRKHLNEAGCTELVLSTLVNPRLWEASGRLGKEPSQEFTFTERKKHLLAPTGEEQITTLVGSVSYRQLPLRLYQISRKFRNELRPRGGLLRTREFMMKDLYSFDSSVEEAASAYDRIKQAYSAIFEEIGVPFAIVDANSGDMGGSLSHEFHYVSETGEDTLVSCTNSSCEYKANLEKAQSSGPLVSAVDIVDGATIPKGRTLSQPLVDAAKAAGKKLVDWRVEEDGVPLVEPVAGEGCVSCGSELKLENGIEIGHTFYLGTRYTDPLRAKVSLPSGETVPMQMGCYGIGITRIIGAVAEKMRDSHGLVWPALIAPYTAVVVSKDPELSQNVATELALHGIEVAYEDRTNQIAHGLRAARESGTPFTIVLGRTWEKDALIEIIPRQGDPLKVERSELAAVLKDRIYEEETSN